MIVTARVIKKGGKGSGFHGHAGRPGKVGGSAADAQTTRKLSLYEFEYPSMMAYNEKVESNEGIGTFFLYPRQNQVGMIDPAKDPVEEFKRLTKDSDYEQCFILTEDGMLKAYGVGRDNGISLPESMVYDHFFENTDFIHNHPASGNVTALSVGDVHTAIAQNMKSISAFGKNASAILTRPEKGWPPFYEFRDYMHTSRSSIDEVAIEAQNKALAQGKSVNEAGNEAWNAVWEYVAPRFDMKYEVVRNG